MEEDRKIPPFDGPPETSPLVKKWMPDASHEEQVKATAQFRGYLQVLYRIYLRLDSKGYLEKKDEERENNTELQ